MAKKNSFWDKIVKVINSDAWKFLEKSKELYSLIIIDLPDPNNLSLDRLYSVSFYKLIRLHLARFGVFVTQATSPMFSRKAFWSIEKSINESGFTTLPYHTYIPSFGEWGFVLAFKEKEIRIKPFDSSSMKFHYLNDIVFKQMRVFPPDIQKLKVKSNRLSNHKLIEYYEKGWDRWYEH